MTPEQWAEKRKQEVLKANGTPEAAEAAYATALAEAKTVMGHPLYTGLQEVNREIAGREQGYKDKISSLEPLAETGRKAQASSQSAEERAATAEREREEIRKQAERDGKAVKEYLEAELKQVPEKFRTLVPAGAPADQLAWIRNAWETGIFGEPAAGRSGHNHQGGGRPEGDTITQSEAAKIPVGPKRDEFLEKKRKGLIKVIPD